MKKRTGSLTQAGAYMILNLVTECRYVGGTHLVSRRWTEHRSLLRRGAHANKSFQKAWDSYGESAFRCILLEAVDGDPDEIVAREQYWMDHFRAQGLTLYNIMPNAGTNRGYRHTKETRAKMRGPRRPWTPEERARQKLRMAGYRCEAGIAAAKARAELQTWPPLKGPNGMIWHVTNVSEFSRQHGLDVSHLAKVLKGQRRIHKGFSLISPRIV